ncbi:DUF4192 domain-containing protein [Cellulomonas sp. SLBN-39]|uniref:DUF4192 domain-containing protein n=1 Tax=Cellulomonas sp. SLBN-39 TaxID=2768446 RepID=UPI0011525788|nr:DUF4192 domain-containing protein [Cellulomonas sp. SLBN-39]TQL03942.1 uncharacterized protein DUF4192 [Cellulomonas sp. SLBN-39]
MEPATTLRIAEPRELLAYVPYRLGFVPARSAVLVSLRGPRHEVGLVVRVDLADLLDPADGARVARTLVSHLDRDGARRAVLVLYLPQGPGVPSGAPAHRAVAHVRQAADVPLGPVDVLVVGDEGYGCLACDHGCCPPGGRPLRDLQSTAVGARMVLEGVAVAASRADVARIALAPAEARRSVARVRARWAAAARDAHAAGGEGLAAWRAGVLAAWRVEVARAGDPTAVPARPTGLACLGRIEAGLADRRVRDAVLVTFVPGTGRLAERSLAGAGPEPADDAAIGQAVAAVVDPARAVPPPSTTGLHEAVLERVVAHGARGAQAPALTLLGLLAWWRGDGARAGVLVGMALEDEPGHRLALLLEGTLDAGLAPGWVRRDA